MQAEMNRRRAIIEGVKPEIDAGRFPIKRTTGEKVIVEADVFTDGHEAVSAALLYRKEETPDWTEVLMTPLVNDRWQAEFEVAELGRYRYTIQGWLDPFKFWSRNLAKRVEAGQDVAVEMLIGAGLGEGALKRGTGGDADRLRAYAAALRSGGTAAVVDRVAADVAAW